MATPNLPPPRPDLVLTDGEGTVSKDGYDLLNEIVRRIKKIEAGLTAAAIPF